MAKSFHNSLIISFYSLMRNNGGYFKSEKQAKMMLGLDSSFLMWNRETGWNNSATMYVTLDEHGIKTFTKTSDTTFKVKQHWERTQSLEEWQAEHDYKSRRSEMIQFLRDESTKYHTFYNDRKVSEEASHMSRFQKRVYMAACNMSLELAMSYNKQMSQVDKDAISLKCQEIRVRKESILLNMAQRGKAYQAIDDSIWDIIRETDRDINNFEKLFPNY